MTRINVLTINRNHQSISYNLCSDNFIAFHYKEYLLRLGYATNALATRPYTLTPGGALARWGSVKGGHVSLTVSRQITDLLRRRGCKFHLHLIVSYSIFNQHLAFSLYPVGVDCQLESL